MPPKPVAPTDTSLAYANTVIQGRFPASVTVPLAQIIMLDAAHGDSNIIDLCTKDLQPDSSYAADSWRRCLIDTGPEDKEIRRNVIRVIVAYRQPLGPLGHDIPAADGYPKLSMVQFTHTDRDHCGGGKALFQALAREKTLQRYFDETHVALHHPKTRSPQWSLSLYPTDPSSQTHPFTVLCWTNSWGVQLGEPANLEQFNVFLQYTFTINGQAQPRSSSPSFQIPAAMIAAPLTILIVLCQVSLFRRSPVGRTTQMVEFNLRAAHKAIFTVTASYPVTTATDGSGKRTVGSGAIPPAPAPPPPGPAPTTDPRYDPVTGQLVPSGERRRADQMYYRIVEGFEQASAQIRSRKNPKKMKRVLVHPMLWTPEQHNTRDFGQNLARMDIVGPTPTIYNQLIGDMMRVEYDQGTVKPGGTGKPPDAEAKDSELHNMASIVTLFRRWPTGTPPPPDPILSMLFTGDAHDRECQIRDTIAGFTGPIPARRVDLLKIPHHGSGLSTSVEFYSRIVADVYLVCARQNNNGLPTLRILEAIVGHTTGRAAGAPPAHIFFSNPDSLWNLSPSDKALAGGADPNGVQSNINLLLSGAKRPGAPGTPGKYNYKCYILKHPVPAGTTWTKDSTSKEKNAGIILLGRDAQGALVVSADAQWWDVWDEDRIRNVGGLPENNLSSYLQLRD